MATAFNLTAKLNVQGPFGVKPVVDKIRKAFKNVSAPVSIKIDNATDNRLKAVNKTLSEMEMRLKSISSLSASVKSNLGSLGGSLKKVSTTTKNAAKSQAEVKSNLDATAKSAKRAASEMEEFGRVSGLSIRRNAGFVIATTVIYGFIRAVKDGIGAAIGFERQLIKIAQVSGRSVGSLSDLTNEVTRLATSLGVSSSALLEASRVLSQAGLSATQTRTALEALAKSDLAPTFDNIASTTEGVIAAMRQFKLESRDLESVLGSINAVAGKFAVESGDIIAAIRRAGGVFAAASGDDRDAKQSLREFIALFTSVRSTTRESGESIATGLRTVFTRIQRRSTIDSLQELGVVLRDVEGRFVGPFEAVKRLNKELSRLDPRDARFAEIVEELGGFRQISKVIPLIQQFATAQKALGVAQKGQGSLTRDAILAQQSLAVQIEKTRERFLALAREIAETDTFRGLAKGALIFANALVSVASNIKPLLPILAVIAGFEALKTGGRFIKGFRRGVTAGPEDGFSRKQIQVEQQNTAAVQANTAALRARARGVGFGRKFAGGGRVRRFASGGITEPSTVRQQLASSITRPFGRASTTTISTGTGKNKRLQGKAVENAPLVDGQTFGGVFLRPTFKPTSAAVTIPGETIRAESGGGSGNYTDKTFNLLLRGMKEDTSNRIQDSIIRKVSEGINEGAGLLEKATGATIPNIDREFLDNFNITTIMGNMFEGMLKRAGGPYEGGASKNKGFDFPSGLGAISSNFIGDDLKTVTTDAKNTFNREQTQEIIKKIKDYAVANAKPENIGAATSSNVLSRISVGQKKKLGMLVSDMEKGKVSPDKMKKMLGIKLQEGEDHIALQQQIAAAAQGLERKDLKAGRFAAGGASGGIEALLTPQELVFGPKATAQAGLEALFHFNETGDPSKLGKFDPRDVSFVPGTGTADSFRTTLPAGSFVVQRDSSLGFPGDFGPTRRMNRGGRVKKFAGGGKVHRFAGGTPKTLLDIANILDPVIRDFVDILAGAGASLEDINAALDARERELRQGGTEKQAQQRGIASVKARRKAVGAGTPIAVPLANIRNAQAKQFAQNPGDPAAIQQAQAAAAAAARGTPGIPFKSPNTFQKSGGVFTNAAGQKENLRVINASTKNLQRIVSLQSRNAVGVSKYNQALTEARKKQAKVNRSNDRLSGVLQQQASTVNAGAKNRAKPPFGERLQGIATNPALLFALPLITSGLETALGGSPTSKGISAGISGASAGVFTGASIGSLGGPVGSAIGGVIGGVVGALNSFKGAVEEAAKEIQEKKISDSLEVISNFAGSLAEGKISPDRVNKVFKSQFDALLNESISTAIKGGEFKGRDVFEKAIPGASEPILQSIEQQISKGVKLSDIVSGVGASNLAIASAATDPELIKKTLSGGLTTGTLQDIISQGTEIFVKRQRQLFEERQTADLLAKTAERANRSISLLSLRLEVLSEGINMASSAGEEFRAVISDVSSGFQSIPKLDLQKISNVSDLINPSITNDRLKLAEGVVGTKATSDIKSVIDSVRFLQDKGLTALTTAASKESLGAGSAENITNKLLKASGIDSINPVVRDLFKSELLQVVSKRQGEDAGQKGIQKLIERDGQQLIEAVTTKVGKTAIENLNQISEAVAQASNEFAENAQLYANTQIEAAKKQDEIAKLQQDISNRLIVLKGGDISPARIVAQLRANVSRQVGAGGLRTTDPNAIAAEVSSIRDRRAELLRRRQSEPGNRNITSELAKLSVKNDALIKALDTLSGDVTVLASIEKRIADIQERRQRARDLIQNIARASFDPEARLELANASKAAIATLLPGKLPINPEFADAGRQLITSIAGTFPEKERKNIEELLTQRDLERIRGVGPVGKRVADSLLNVTGFTAGKTEEAKLTTDFENFAKLQIKAAEAQQKLITDQLPRIQANSQNIIKAQAKAIQDAVNASGKFADILAKSADLTKAEEAERKSAAAKFEADIGRFRLATSGFGSAVEDFKDAIKADIEYKRKLREGRLGAGAAGPGAAPVFGPGEFASGGIIPGAFQGHKKDSKIIAAQPGEFVVNRRATMNNRELLEALNNSGRGFADGGMPFGSSTPIVRAGEKKRKEKDLKLARFEAAIATTEGRFGSHSPIIREDKFLPRKKRTREKISAAQRRAKIVADRERRKKVRQAAKNAKLDNFSSIDVSLLGASRSAAAIRKPKSVLPETNVRKALEQNRKVIEEINSIGSPIRLGFENPEITSPKLKRLMSDVSIDASNETLRKTAERQADQAKQFGMSALPLSKRLANTNLARSVRGGAQNTFKLFGNLFGFASGGGVDSSIIAAQPGEFVVNKRAASSNMNLLRALNSGGKIPKFQNGGVVGGSNKQGSMLSSGAISALNSFGSAAQQLTTALTGLSNLAQISNTLSQAIQQLQNIVIPERIEIQSAPIQVNVVINGTEAFNQMKPEFQKMVTSEIQRSLSKSINPITGETSEGFLGATA